MTIKIENGSIWIGDKKHTRNRIVLVLNNGADGEDSYNFGDFTHERGIRFLNDLGEMDFLPESDFLFRYRVYDI